MRRLTRNHADGTVRRRPPPTRRYRNAVQAILVLGIAATAVFGPIWLWRSGAAERTGSAVLNAAIERTADFGLRIETVSLTGGVETEPAEILAALGARRGAPIFAFEATAARARIEALPWIASAAVTRRLPGEIRVEVEEHLPLAIWQNDGQIKMIAADGDVIEVAPPTRFTHLPVVVGPDAPNHALALIRLLGAEPELARQVAAAVRVGGRRWNLEFDNGISVHLPERDASSAWRRLAALAREKQLLDKDIIAIDLRLHPGKLVIRRAPGAPLDPQQAGKET